MRYLILLGNVFSKRDWERFGCDLFVQRGYEVVPVELLSFLKPGQQSVLSHDGFQSIKNALHVSTHQEIEELISGIRLDDLVLNALSFSDKTVPIFWLLNKYNINYAAISLGKIPLGWFSNYMAARNLMEYIKFKYADLRGIAYRAKMLFGYVTEVKYDWKKVQPPRWWLDAGKDLSIFGTAPVKRSCAQRIAVHSFDMETNKHIEEKVEKSTFTQRRPYVLFLDDGFLGHPDMAYHGHQCLITPKTYTESLSRLFNALECKHGYDVVIAQHPKSEERAIREFWGDRIIISGETASLSKYSDLVITHCSTSISYAVHHRKPIMYVTTDELERDPVYGPMVARMSSWLCSHRVNLDNQTEIEAFALPEVDKRAYQAYESSYLCEPEVKIESIWTELAQHFEVGLHARTA